MNNLTEILRLELAVLEGARDIFRHSFEKCSRIGDLKIGMGGLRTD